MSNYLLGIDPVLLLTDNQKNRLDKTSNSQGDLADNIQNILSDKFEFAEVYQSTTEKHEMKMDNYLLSKQGPKKMNFVGEFQTPSGLMSYIVVDDQWVKNNPNLLSVAAGAKLDDRIDINKLKGNDGATKEGETTGFIRYNNNQAPSMIIVPSWKHKYNDTVEAMEAQADAREKALRNRPSKLQMIHREFEAIKQGSGINAFMSGWRLINKMNDYNEETKKLKHPIDESQQDKNPDELNDDKLHKSLTDLSIEMTAQNDSIDGNEMYMK